MNNFNSKEQIFIDDDYDKVNIFKSSESHSSLKVAKYSNLNDISLFDTGASRSGTNNKNKLTNIETCNNITVQGAFGPPYRPSLKGSMGPLGLETVVIPDMNETLLSVFQICNGGSQDFQCISVFSTEGCRIFKFDSVREALKLMHDTGTEIMRGTCKHGLYYEDKSFNSNDIRMYMTHSKTKSKYDEVHNALGHPGKLGMSWHNKNTLNAQYTIEDENKSRPVCEGCILGGMKQTSTDHLREHRINPTRPGQIFVMDAFTHKHRSFRGMFYADIFRDLATQMVYVVYTKDRSASELVIQMGKELDKHPEWALNLDITQRRFFRVDAESNYRSAEFTQFLADRFYTIEKTPSRDKHAGGVAERTVGILTEKTNIAMLAPQTTVPHKYWELAMTYSAITMGFNFSSAIGTSPYYYVTGQKANVKYLHPFWSMCYVFIPLEFRQGKLGSPRAHKARFVGYDNTTILFPNYMVMEILDNNNYGKIKSSKDVIFDNSINNDQYKDNEAPYDREFKNPDTYIPYAMRMNVPHQYQGADAIMPITPDIVIDNKPKRDISLAERNKLRNKLKNKNKNNKNEKSVKHTSDTQSPIVLPNHDSNDSGELSHEKSDDIILNNDNNDYDKNTNEENLYNNDDLAVYWYNFHIKNDTYPLIMCETQHNMFALTPVRDPNCPRTYEQAMKIPSWAAAIDKELTKFEINHCLSYVPYNGQHLVPMMWLFNIKTDGTHKARLVGRGDLMKAYVDFDPDAVYCGNVSACSIKMCVAIAAKYKLEMRGGDLEGAYLVTPISKDYRVYLKTPDGYKIPEGMCMEALGNLYGFPPAGQNFSKEFDKCVTECGFKNTPWDLKFFFKWKNNRPILLIAHSDDFRVFCDKRDLSEWDALIINFNKHKYKVTDCSDKEFVGIRITRDEEYNYFMDQHRMIDDILKELNVTGAKGERLPYPMDLPKISRLDNASPSEQENCKLYPYRRVVGQLMYGMVHTMVTIMYALNVLSRYNNNPGPRHIQYLKHLVRFVKYSKKDRLIFRTSDGPYDIKSMTNTLQLRFQCDADLAGNDDNKHSQTSYLGYLGGSLICWCSTDQGSVSTSTAESEIKAVNHALRGEVIANRGILTMMGWVQQTTVIEEDNKACVDASKILQMTRNLRHLDIMENWFKEQTDKGVCKIIKIDSAQNNSDIGTKRVNQKVFDYLTNSILDRNNN